MKDGKTLKQEVLAAIRADSRQWLGRALFRLRRLPVGEYTGEGIRNEISALIGEPKNSHVWGALINTAIKKKYLTPTGEVGRMKKPSSHDHNTPVHYLNGGL